MTAVSARSPLQLIRFIVVLLAVIGLVGCGVDSSDGAPDWEVKGIGAAGGQIAAGDVVVDVAQGALNEDTAVSILPQLEPYIILPGPNDPCLYSYLGPIWCVGPVGTPLQVASTLRVYYDEGAIPPPWTEADLVLMEWNDTLGVLVPNLNAVQNTAGNYFENPNYLELGHVAIGIRDCTNATGQIVIAGPANVVGGPSDGVHITEITSAVATFLSPELPSAFIPSPDASSILLQLPDNQNDGSLLATIPATGGATTVVIDGSENISSFDPLHGWMSQAPANRVYFTQFRPASMSISLPAVLDPNVSQDVLAWRPSDGTGPVNGIHGITSSAGFIQDIRQSPSGDHFLIYWQGFATSGPNDSIDMIETSTGNEITTMGIPRGGGQHTPRFNPDGMGVHLVDSFQTSVVTYNLDGTNEQTIFSFGPGNIVTTIQDAVLAPDGQTLAVIVRAANTDLLYLVTADVAMQGIVHETYDLGSQSTYDEVIWNPAANVLYIDPGTSGVRAFTMDPAAPMGSRIVDEGVLPAQDMRLMDIERVTGNLLHLTLQQVVINVNAPNNASTAATQGPGICVTDAVGGNLQIGQPLGIDIYAARWLRSFRRTGGVQSDLVR